MPTDPEYGAQEHGEAHAHPPGGAEHLIKMANDIGHFFRTEPVREDAVAGIANHIHRFWTKRMREKLAAHQEQYGDDGLEDLPIAALLSLATKQHRPPDEPPGGDAG